MASGSDEGALLDGLCAELYNPATPEGRVRAERALAEFADSDQAFQKSMLMLERGTSGYSSLVAAQTLTKLVSRPNNNLPLEDRIELAKYLLNYLGARHAKLEPFVRQALARLWGRLVKLGWFDFTRVESSGGGDADKSGGSEFVFRSAVASVVKMVVAKGSMAEVVVGVECLAALVTELNSQTGLGSIAKHRKTAAVFRDEELYLIFQLAVEFLGDAADQPTSFADASQVQLVGQLLELGLACLSFDFIGSIVDDTSDDNASVQVPTSWRSAFVSGSLVKLFFRLFDALASQSTLAAKVLGILVQLTSVRRTIFNNAERGEYLAALVKGTLAVLQKPTPGLQSEETYHEFCRLVARLKSNYQLMELTKVSEYQTLIGMLAEFTVSSLRLPEASTNNVHYLLSFWQRMVSSQPYVKATEPHQLGRYAPLVTKAFVETRLEQMEGVISGESESPFEDFTSLSQQMEQLGVIGRCEYLQTATLLTQAFSVSAQAYASSGAGTKEGRVAEGRVTWLVFLVGSAIGGRVAFSSSEEQDAADGELISKVLQLMRLSDERLAAGSSRGSEHLELAAIYFLAQFRKIYISDQVQKTSKVYAKLQDELGLSDEAAVLGVFIRKVVANLKYWAGNEKLVEETLALLNDLSCGFTSARKLIALPEIQFLLRNHTSQEFPFLGTETSLQAMKGRTTFHAALTRLLLVDLPENPEALDDFLSPIESSLKELAALFASSNDPAQLRAQEKARKAVIGLARDLRGVANALNVKSAFGRLFDWLYPDALDVFAKAMEVWYADPEVTTAVLRLGAELCQNRSQRLAFEATSPNAILLFKEASRLVQAYGQGVLSLGELGKGEDVWRCRLKGVSISMGLLKAALSGAYVNFGVFR